MPKRNMSEFYWDEKRQLYRKRIKNPATGKYVDVYGKTKAETRSNAAARLESLVREAAADSCPYVYQYAAKWYQLNTVGLSDKRRSDYRVAINRHICPVIGPMLLCDVCYDDALAVMACASGLSKSAQQKIATTMRRIFAAAERNGLIKKSPCSDIKAGGAPAAEKEPLTAEQQARLVAAVRGTRAEQFVMIGLYTGLRREEILGLEWDCVHLDASPPYIAVRRALRWGDGNHPATNEILKTKAARRDIPMPPQLVECLRAAKERSASDYVITDAHGGPVTRTSFRRLWDVIRVRSERQVTRTVDGKKELVWLRVGDKIPKHNVRIALDFKVTPHQLRHTYITNLVLASGDIKDIKSIQYLAGHATVAMTLNVYTHVIERSPRRTSSVVALAFGGNIGGKDAAPSAQTIDSQ